MTHIVVLVEQNIKNMEKKESGFYAKIYLAGDIEVIKQICRKYCYENGFCVTINPTLFIYTGGEEFGVEIGCINYPRFPKSEDEVLKCAKELAELCREGTYQHSYLILTPIQTIWNSRKE